MQQLLEFCRKHERTAPMLLDLACNDQYFELPLSIDERRLILSQFIEKFRSEFYTDQDFKEMLLEAVSEL